MACDPPGVMAKEEEEQQARPGVNVLTTGMVYMDNNNNSGSGGKKGKGSNASGNNNNNSKGFFKRLLKSSKNKNKPEQDLKYLQCFDIDGKEIMIPLIMSGVFSPVGDTSMANYDAVYELQDLIMAFGLPVNAQLIHANARERATCPQGVLRFYGTREEELAVLSRLENDASIPDTAMEKVEVSVEREIALQRGLPRRRLSVASTRPMPISSLTSEDPRGLDSKEQVPEHLKVHTEVELPKRVPSELKKSRSSGILDKLSVRKVRKERAKLKELRSDDVFSKRINRCELTYEDFFNGLDGDEEGDHTKQAKEAENGEAGIKLPQAVPEATSSVYGTAKETSTTGIGFVYGTAKNTSIAGTGFVHGTEATTANSIYGKAGESAPTPSTMYGTYGSTRGECRFSVSMQNRDLPPIPINSDLSPGRHDSSGESKDSLYEHLPMAPQPPHRSISDPAHDNLPGDADDLDHEDDGYMVPKSVHSGGDSAYSSSVDVQLRRKPPAVPRDIKARLKKCRSEMFPPEMLSTALGLSDNSVTSDDARGNIDIDQLFNFMTNPRERPYRSTAASSQWADSTTQLYGCRVKDKRGAEAVPAWRAEVQRSQRSSGQSSTLTRKSVERLDLETRSTHGGRGGSGGAKPRAQSVDPNATIRSHNLRKSNGGLMELFHFDPESFRDQHSLRQNTTLSGSSSTSPLATSSPGIQYSHQEPVFSARSQRAPPPAVERGGGESPYIAPITTSVTSSMKGNGGYFRPQPYVAYADSEPAYRKSYPKAASVSGFSDSAYPKQGDDSAISMGSRGENPYGFNNDSEYSYNEYPDNGGGGGAGHEDNWYPPDDISGLTVQDVSRSLRYIGMKDRVVLRFANEQIDGSMLCSLDKRLLKEGFPELNALEIKKILDFVRGWRPKKR